MWPVNGQNSGLPSSLLGSSLDMLPNSLVPVELCEGQEVFRNPFPKTQSVTLMSQSRVKLIYQQHERECPVQVLLTDHLLDLGLATEHKCFAADTV